MQRASQRAISVALLHLHTRRSLHHYHHLASTSWTRSRLTIALTTFLFRSSPLLSSSSAYLPRWLSTSPPPPPPLGLHAELPSLDVVEAAAELKKRRFEYVIDCREDDEVKHGMIDGAYHIPLGQLIRDMSKPVVQKLKDKPVLVYCRSGKRSAMAVARQHPTHPRAAHIAGHHISPQPFTVRCVRVLPLCAVLNQAGFDTTNLDGGYVAWLSNSEATADTKPTNTSSGGSNNSGQA